MNKLHINFSNKFSSNLFFMLSMLLLVTITNGIRISKSKENLTEYTPVEAPVINVNDNDLSPYLKRKDNFLSFDPMGSITYGSTIPDYDISSMIHILNIDGKTKNCNINVIEQIKFKLPAKSNKLDYLIISQKTPLFGFFVNVKKERQDETVGIKSLKIYKDSSFRPRVFIDSDEKKLLFRDRWLLSIEFRTPVDEIELEINYIMQRAILIDSINEINLLKIALINPIPITIKEHLLVINITNFKDLSANSLKVPYNTKVEQINTESVSITTKKPFGMQSEYNINLTLPYALTSCEGKFINIIYYALIGMTVIIILMSAFTLAYLYKE